MAKETELQKAEKKEYYHATYQNTRNGFYTVVMRSITNALFVQRFDENGQNGSVSGDYLHGAFQDSVERGILKFTAGVEPSGLVEHTDNNGIFPERWTVCHCAECESIAIVRAL